MLNHLQHSKVIKWLKSVTLVTSNKILSRVLNLIKSKTVKGNTKVPSTPLNLICYSIGDW